MSRFKIIQLLKKKGILLTFLIVCSLFICKKTFAVWSEKCCFVNYISSNLIIRSRIQIYFKFFELKTSADSENSYLENFIAEYLMDDEKTYIHLMSASSKDQDVKTSAIINLKDKRKGEKMGLNVQAIIDQSKMLEIKWRDHMQNYPLVVLNHPRHKNQTWLWVYWYPKENQNKITHIRVTAHWHQSGTKSTEVYQIAYPIYRKMTMLNSNSLNFSNSFPIQEIRTEDKINIVKAYKEANAIVIEGANSERILVYTTTGNLVKSVVADCDVLQIPVPVNQLYIVNIGQASYKVAL